MDVYKYEPHDPWVPLRGVGKTYCAKCGLVNLNNELTRWCVNKGCNNEDHPGYKDAVKRLGRPK